MDEFTELELRTESGEAALIGAVGYHPDGMSSIIDRVPSNAFYSPHREIVWEAFRVLNAARTPIDPVGVARHLSGQGRFNSAVQHVVTVEMSEATPTDVAASYADVIMDLAQRRGLMLAITRARHTIATHTGSASETLAIVRNSLDALVTEDDSPQTLGWGALMEEFNAAHGPDGSKPGIPTPWYELDELIGGLYGSRLYIVGGRPGDGKTTMALNIAQHAAVESGKQVLVFSKEMPSLDITGRLLAAGAQIDLREINHRRISDMARQRITHYVTKVGSVPLRVNASSVSLAGIKTLARTQHHRRGLDVLVVDYLQLVRADVPGRNREQEVGQVSRELKALAMELDIAVVVPAQLNRSPVSRADSRPTKSDLRDSGQIEQDADAVILLWHRTDDDKPTGRIILILDKNRHGPTAEIELRWDGAHGMIG